MTKPLRRLRDFPEIMDAEAAAVLDPSIAATSAISDAPVLNSAAKAVCGVGYEEISAWCRSERDALTALEEQGFVVSDEDWFEAWDKYDEKQAKLLPSYDDIEDPAGFDAEVVKAYRSIGWDATNERGQVLLVAANLLVPFMAAANGVPNARFPEEGSEIARSAADVPHRAAGAACGA